MTGSQKLSVLHGWEVRETPLSRKMTIYRHSTPGGQGFSARTLDSGLKAGQSALAVFGAKSRTGLHGCGNWRRPRLSSFHLSSTLPQASIVGYYLHTSLGLYRKDWDALTRHPASFPKGRDSRSAKPVQRRIHATTRSGGRRDQRRCALRERDEAGRGGGNCSGGPGNAHASEASAEGPKRSRRRHSVARKARRSFGGCPSAPLACLSA
jgi:hypothetical protein